MILCSIHSPRPAGFLWTGHKIIREWGGGLWTAHKIIGERAATLWTAHKIIPKGELCQVRPRSQRALPPSSLPRAGSSTPSRNRS